MKCYEWLTIINDNHVVLGRVIVDALFVYERGSEIIIEEVKKVNYVRVSELLPDKTCITKRELPKLADKILKRWCRNEAD